MSPSRAQTETAVLGGLSVTPMTGYALREAIRDVLGHFWSESFGQIYPTLNRLEHDGCVERQPGDGTAATPFRITADGLDRLKARLREPIKRVPPRNGLLLRLFFGRELGAEACAALVHEARDQAVADLARFEAIRAEIASDAPAADEPYWLLTVSAGEHSARAALAWADEALEQLAALAPKSRNHPRERNAR